MSNYYKPSNGDFLHSLDQGFPDLLAALGWTATKRTPTHLEGACPIHRGTKSNFHLDLKPDGKWLATCRSGCGGEGWTATRFLAAFFSIPHPEAIAKAGKLLGIRPTDQTPAFIPRRKSLKHLAAIAEKQAKEAEREKKNQAIAARRPALLAAYLKQDWHYNLWEKSPVEIPTDLDEQARLFVRHLFDPGETVWMGGQADSGKPRHAVHFRTREEWLRDETPLPPRIAAGTFSPGVFSRSKESITAAPFIVIECDELIGKEPETQAERDENRKLSAALLSLMQDRFKFTLRAVIDTGNRSLHGWFKHPSPAALEALLLRAAPLGIDEAVLKSPHNPLRLPGCIHHKTKQPARLCYLNPRSF